MKDIDSVIKIHENRCGFDLAYIHKENIADIPELFVDNNTLRPVLTHILSHIFFDAIKSTTYRMAFFVKTPTKSSEPAIRAHYGKKPDLPRTLNFEGSIVKKDLTNSSIDRQNILNNPYALAEIEKAAGIRGIPFEGKTVLLKEQVADFFEVTLRTVENYLEQHAAELAKNGYEVLKGKRLKSLKEAIQTMDVPEMNFGNITKTPQLGIFDFRAFLNLAMLVSESDRAKLLRQAILDIVIDTINQRTGGGTKYINQRDEDFLHSAFIEENYRKEFTDALRDCVDMGNFKYAVYTNKIYVSIFRENAKEYKKILSLEDKDHVRSTLYSEVLDLIAAYECGFADLLQHEAKAKGRKLKPLEVDALFKSFETQSHWKPLIEKARIKMASRDLAFRDALHHQLKEYVTPLQRDEFERFIGERSKELNERLEEAKDVMKRLKERD